MTGPEMRNLSSDAVVWPADQTKKIMRTAANGQNIFGSAANKTGDTSGPVKFGSNSGSASGTTASKSKKDTKNKSKNDKKNSKYAKRLFDRWYNAALRFEKFQKKVELAEKKLEN